MLISLKDFRDKLKDFEFYQDILSFSHSGTILCIPRRPKEEVLRIRELLWEGKSSREISLIMKVDAHRICDIKSNLKKPLRVYGAYSRLHKKYGVKTWKLIERLQGCSVRIVHNYAKICSSKYNEVIEKCCVQDRSVKEVAEDVNYSAGHVAYIVRTYLKAMDTAYIDRRFKSSRM